MANLQAALDEYKSEVASLDKQRTDYIQANKLLESKTKFLKIAVDDYEKSLKSAKISYEAGFAKLKATEAELEEKITIAFEDLDAVEKQKQVAESELETLEQQHEQEVIGHNKRLTSVKSQLKAVEVLKTDASKELTKLVDRIGRYSKQIGDMQDKCRQAESDTESELAELAQLIESAKQRLGKADDKVEGVLKTLEDITAQIELKKTELDKLDKKHQEFISYEKRAMTALKARESALLAGEAELKVAKRRNPASVLDNLG